MPANLFIEAVRITDELGKVVFVGALAVNYYVAYRATHDIDLAIAFPLDESKLVKLGYIKWDNSRGDSWQTPRGFKVDFYTRDVGGIPVGWILENAVEAKRGKGSFLVICLEGLVLTKHRAGRTSDVADLQQLLIRKGAMIRWDLLKGIAKPLEVTELRQLARALSS